MFDPKTGRLRDPETGRFMSDPAKPPSPYGMTDAQRRAEWKRLAEDQKRDLKRMSEALRQNPEYRGRIEVPTQAIANRTQKILNDLSIENISVRVVPSQ